MLAGRARDHGAFIAYVNMVGGQDELVFDGDSMIFLPDGTLAYRAAQFAEELFIVDVLVPEHRRPGIDPVAVTEPRGTDLVAPELAIGDRLEEDAEI